MLCISISIRIRVGKYCGLWLVITRAPSTEAFNFRDFEGLKGAEACTSRGFEGMQGADVCILRSHSDRGSADFLHFLIANSSRRRSTPQKVCMWPRCLKDVIGKKGVLRTVVCRTLLFTRPVSGNCTQTKEFAVFWGLFLCLLGTTMLDTL